MVRKLLKHIRGILSVIVLAVMLSACGSDALDENCPGGNAVYFWRKSFSLSDTEREFIDNNDIKTIYLHMFDVVAESGKTPRPDNTVLFDSTFRASQEIVPTVFMVESLLKDTTINLSGLADKIIGRVDRMMTCNGYALPKEIQIDYDWAQTDRTIDISSLLKKQQRGFTKREGGFRRPSVCTSCRRSLRKWIMEC